MISWITRLRNAGVALACVVALPQAALCLPMWPLQAVGADGLGTNPLVGADPVPANRVTVTGIALAGLGDLVNPAQMYTIMLQDTEELGRGGIQVWSGVFYYGGLPYPPAAYIPFNEGDLIRVSGYLANHNGKVFINERHSPAPEMQFTVEILNHVGLPDPELVSSVSNVNWFDQTRRFGGERYQTRFIMLHGVTVGAGNWAAGNTLPISDQTGAVDMLLSARGLFEGAKPDYQITVVGIMDQEDPVAPFTGNYRLWVKRQTDVARSVFAIADIPGTPKSERIALARMRVVEVNPDAGQFTLQDAKGDQVTVTSVHKVNVDDIVTVMGDRQDDDSIAAVYVSIQASPASGNVIATIETVVPDWGYQPPTGKPIYMSLIDPVDGELDAYQMVPDKWGLWTQELAAPVDPNKRYTLRLLPSNPFLGVEQEFDAIERPVLFFELTSGDADSDGKITLFDYLILDRFFGQKGAMGDMDGDGEVTIFDYLIIDRNFGAASG